ncbi:MAG: hypothetical protein V4496_03195 [Pseudomonadota bacterium]
MSYSELLDDIFNTLNIACYIFVERALPGMAKAICLKIIGSEQELKKITDIATEVQAYATDKRYEVGYPDRDFNQKKICKREINIGGFSPEYLGFDKRVSDAYNAAFDVPIHETISHVYRSASLKILLEAIPASSYGEAMQLGISQFSSTSSSVDDQSHTLNKETATSP